MVEEETKAKKSYVTTHQPRLVRPTLYRKVYEYWCPVKNGMTTHERTRTPRRAVVRLNLFGNSSSVVRKWQASLFGAVEIEILCAPSPGRSGGLCVQQGTAQHSAAATELS